jgi:hypothetical protein
MAKVRFSGKIRSMSSLSNKELEDYVKKHRPSKKATDEIIRRIKRR